ncbi:MAG: DUF58 domain-containing protein [Gammaproteobacteria bacterium]|nr:DUF58 domain-containing protein [Gammaproteobacteria bacterium]
MSVSLSSRLRTRVADWAKQRQGNDPHAVALKRRRIYILPTRYGVVFAALVFAMLLGSLNYGASLGFALTFLLAGLGLVVVHHCHNNLLATKIRFAGAAPVFAGDEAEFRFAVQNEADVPRFELGIETETSRDGPVDIGPGGTETLRLNLPTTKRGWQRLARFSVVTTHPGNLFRAWTWINMDARCLVYPAPAPPGRPLPAGSDTLGTRGAASREEDDFVGLRDAVPGDPPRRIAWKAFARSDQLLYKEFAGSAERPCVFSWDDVPELDVEDKLSQLTRWCLDAADLQLSFGLKLPEQTIALGSGDRHLHDCLQALALHGLAE